MTIQTELDPYPASNPSAAEWLGNVPSHWALARLKSCAADVADLTSQRKQNDAYVALEHVESWTGRIIEPDDEVIFESQVKRFQARDILFGKLRPYLAKVTQPQRGGMCVGEFLVLRPRKGIIAPSFLERLMRSKPMIELVDASTFGAKMPRANWQFVGNVAIPLPPLDEQAAIVRYLDHTDETINRYISAKERLIALMREQRQAVIHQAVTRGLDPDVKLKDSGVEWLGEVPEHWEVRRIKSLTAVKRGASPRPIDDSKYFSNNGEYAWVRIADVTASNHFLETTTQKLSKLGQSLSVQLQPGALFMSIAGSVGKPMITKIKCCIHDGFVYFPSLVSEQAFMYQILSTSSPFVGLGKFATQLNLNTDTVGGIHVPYPPISERRQITAFLEDSSAKFDKAISQAHHQIDLMNEYRTRLIADVVTGQLDVRDAAVELHI